MTCLVSEGSTFYYHDPIQLMPCIFFGAIADDNVFCSAARPVSRCTRSFSVVLQPDGPSRAEWFGLLAFWVGDDGIRLDMDGCI